MELIFPIAAIIVLCFVFVARRVLITHYVLVTAEQCSHSIKALSSSTAASKASRLGRRGESLIRDTSGTADTN